MKTELNTVPTAFCDNNMRTISCYKSMVFNSTMTEGAIIARLVELDVQKDNKENLEKFSDYTGYNIPFVDISDDEIKAMIEKMTDFGERVQALQTEHEKEIEAMNNEACKVIRDNDDYDDALKGVKGILIKRYQASSAFLNDIKAKSKVMASFGLIFGVIERLGKSAEEYTDNDEAICALPFDDKLISMVPSQQYQPLKASYDIYNDYYQAISSVVACFDKCAGDDKKFNIVKTYFGTGGETLRNSLTIDEFIKKSQEVDERQNELNRLMNIRA
ncbi:hypothetical protein MB98_13670 [Salmonella enterica]|nr:hypothetical protein [Salmonella enterica]ECL9777917.1 hypothetical protein [Salmonella enterica subsp. enterica serovar Rubislaw]EAX2323518.1 hypothetical protein [Salmonella enterica]EAX5684697.1 hypothetical protein [Salmonella enterica]EAY9792552.1 hypothetical protein [Salmonella enterica]